MIRYSLCFVLLLSFVPALSGCKAKKQEPAGKPSVLVTAAEAISKDVPVYVDEIGSCAASETVAIRAQASGQITEIHFTDGVTVKKGDLLFTINPRPYEAALRQAQANLSQSKASLELAKSDFERAGKLRPTGALSQVEYDIRKNAIIVNEAKIEADEAAVQTAQISLDYCSIKSPIDGRVGQRGVDIGNVVTANSGDSKSPLLTIHRLDPIYILFSVTENEFEAVRRELAKGDLKVAVQAPGNPEEKREGTLTFIDNAVDEETGRIKLRATLPNKDYYFWPGQFVQVRLVLSTEKDAILVPSESIQNSQDGPFVYIILANQTVEMRPVKALRTIDGKTIVSGVQPQETVVTDGQLRLSPGAKVQIKTPSASEVHRP